MLFGRVGGLLGARKEWPDSGMVFKAVWGRGSSVQDFRNFRKSRQTKYFVSNVLLVTDKKNPFNF